LIAGFQWHTLICMVEFVDELVQYNCPHCGCEVRIRRAHMGQPASCPGCRKSFDTLPESDADKLLLRLDHILAEQRRAGEHLASMRKNVSTIAAIMLFPVLLGLGLIVLFIVLSGLASILR
jgi:peptide subunit release factor 1 (eRF1)